MPDARVQAAIANWGPRLIANGVDYNDFVAHDLGHRALGAVAPGVDRYGRGPPRARRRGPRPRVCAQRRRGIPARRGVLSLRQVRLGARARAQPRGHAGGGGGAARGPRPAGPDRGAGARLRWMGPAWWRICAAPRSPGRRRRWSCSSLGWTRPRRSSSSGSRCSSRAAWPPSRSTAPARARPALPSTSAPTTRSQWRPSSMLLAERSDLDLERVGRGRRQPRRSLRGAGSRFRAPPDRRGRRQRTI